MASTVRFIFGRREFVKDHITGLTGTVTQLMLDDEGVQYFYVESDTQARWISGQRLAAAQDPTDVRDVFRGKAQTD